MRWCRVISASTATWRAQHLRIKGEMLHRHRVVEARALDVGITIMHTAATGSVWAIGAVFRQVGILIRTPVHNVRVILVTVSVTCFSPGDGGSAGCP